MSVMEFRNALGCFATGVCLISVNDSESGPLALTANSFSSVSLEPPLVSWSIQNDSECFREYTECIDFGISVLCADQDRLSSHYANKGSHDARNTDFEEDPRGVPLLKRAVARFSCKMWGRHLVGDHHIIIGEVVDYRAGDQTPLLFHRGQYRHLVPPTD